MNSFPDTDIDPGFLPIAFEWKYPLLKPKRPPSLSEKKGKNYKEDSLGNF